MNILESSYLSAAEKSAILARDFGAQNPASITSAIYRASLDLFNAYGGGEVLCPAGGYNISEYQLGTNLNNVHIRGENGAPAFGPVGTNGGTEFRCMTGNFAVWFRNSTPLTVNGNLCRMSGINVTSNGVEYGVIMSCSAAQFIGSAQGFQYGFLGWGLLRNKIAGSFSYNVKAGFVVVDPSAEQAAYEYPILTNYGIPASEYVANAGFTFDGTVRGNARGMILRNCNLAKISGVVEGNKHQAVILFDSQFNDFDQLHLEANNNASASVSDIDGVTVCKTSATEYLKGSQNGVYGSGDIACDVLIKESTESTTFTGHGTKGNIFRSLRWTPGAHTVTGVRIRSGYNNLFERPIIGGGGNEFFGGTQYAVATEFTTPDYKFGGSISQAVGTATHIVENGEWGTAGTANMGVMNVKKLAASTSIISCIGDNIPFAPGAGKTFSFYCGNTNGAILFSVSNGADNGAVFCTTSYKDGAITLQGDGAFVNSNSPGASQIGIFKSAGSEAVSIKMGTSLNGVIAVTVIGATVTAVSSPA